MTTMTPTDKTRTITITDHPPVRIKEKNWPVVAHGQYKAFDGQYDFQANRTYEANIRVRQHDDGRAIVYGRYDYDTHFQGEDCFVARAGVLLSNGADIVSAISSVGSILCAQARDFDEDFCAHIDAAVRDCVNDMPAIDID